MMSCRLARSAAMVSMLGAGCSVGATLSGDFGDSWADGTGAATLAGSDTDPSPASSISASATDSTTDTTDSSGTSTAETTSTGLEPTSTSDESSSDTTAATDGEDPCGNGIVDRGEDCDGDAGGTTCADLGYEGGTLGCTPGCVLDESACWFCGDGIKNGFEQCDTFDLGGLDCGAFAGPLGPNYTGGTLGCDIASCTYVTTGCSFCGDGVAQADEPCDGGDLAGETCESLDLGTGTLACAGGCDFVADGCSCLGDDEACNWFGPNLCCPPGFKGNVNGACGAGSGTCS